MSEDRTQPYGHSADRRPAARRRTTLNTTVTDPIRGTSEPDRYWTTTNLGEACPDVMSPMCWSVWEESAELGWLYSMYALGVIPKRRVTVSPDVNDRGLSCFYGRQALNVDAIRRIMADLPGVDGDDFERDLMGSVRPDAPQYKGSLTRVPALLVRAPYALLRTGKRLRDRHDVIYKKWTATVFGPPGALRDQPIDRLVAGREAFKQIFKVHCVVRFIFQGGQSAVTGVAEKAGGQALAVELLSGVGDVNETRMADDLWRLGQGQLTEELFMRSWGYHGPNEGNPFTTVWRENPAPIRALAAATAQRGERPSDRAAQAQAAGLRAEQRLLAATPAVQRPAVRWLVARMRNIVRTLQIGKAGYLMALDLTRHAAREVGAQLVENGVLHSVDDVFMFTIEECQALVRGAVPNPREIVEVRRANRAEYKAMVLPLAFTGMPIPVERESEQSGVGIEFSGAASGGAAVEGRARLVLDPAEDVELEEGDILVCRFTDPSWAPLMTLAEALVIDIGGSASHGAVVARELGIPYVIGTEKGTRTVHEGDRILVDGGNNLVRVLHRAADTAERPAAV
ncbi:Prodigiosin synthesizing transferase PigC [Mycolicibacterium vanbaalenii]|uniref:Prodigiosin synthesizing transferase PigC n=1 Tax=Mycolicibacterium vanbaalenii TaxID=110539 RepID=A0A5S9R4D2_MYCVN|nr:Prodigiosin synthesizing transferase PigC [Mycolicibacterium vanbaalenii]